jgi:hypothetical protein
MNAAVMAEELGLTLTNQKIESVSSLLASRAKSSEHTFAPSATEVFKVCRAEVRAVLLTMLGSRTREEQRREFARLFPKYLALSLAVSHFASAVVPRDIIERLSRESICEIEADFRDKGLVTFGASIRSQALFTIWTLRKANEVVTQIVSASLEESKKEDDRLACVNFTLNALRAQLSLDCLHVAMNEGIAIYPEVSEEFLDDLRAMVNAYSWARRGLEARVPTEDGVLDIPSMDDEDQHLLDAAFASASQLAEGL